MSEEAEVLFTITTNHLNSGLRGYPVGTCRTSAVHPDTGVAYVGYPINKLADLDPEAVAFLLLERRLPTEEEIASFKADLRARSGIDPKVLELLRGLPREGHPMEWLISGLVFVGMTSKTGDYVEDARNVIAWAPELVAAIFRLRHGWGDPIPARPELGLVENFVHMLGVPGVDEAKLTRLLRTFYVLHMDHGGGNLSTFTGKAVASGAADMYASLAAAMCGLSGPLHGRANQDCLEFVRKVGTSDAGNVEAFVRQTLASGGKIYGFGHAVLRQEDPRATIQYGVGEEVCPDDPLFRTAVTLRSVAVKVLKEFPKVSNPYPNVDAVSGSLLNACGLSDSNYYTVLFGLSRITGIAAQIVDERLRARGGKGVPIYRPKYIAQDQPPR
ncbi:MAG: citrate synthase [Myxococcota bacterium]|jgi:citrate synthase